MTNYSRRIHAFSIPLITCFISAVFFPLLTFGADADTQPAAPVEMADSMRANGKIYVVVLVISTIFAGIILTLIYLDRKIKKLENQKS